MIYFIAAGTEAVKIGFTTCPLEGNRSRLATLQTGNHLPLTLLAFGAGTQQDERALHHALRDHHIRGEWFAHHPDVLEAAEALAPCETPERAQSPLSPFESDVAANVYTGKPSDKKNAGAILDGKVSTTEYAKRVGCNKATIQRALQRVAEHESLPACPQRPGMVK